jgi:hypothetical protein
MSLERVLKYSIEAYLKNIKLISLFAIAAFFAFLIPLLLNTPIFISLGGTFLRIGSIPDMQPVDFAIILFALLISLYLISFAIVNINLVIKSQRTFTNIKTEVLKNITGYTFEVFLLFLFMMLIFLIIQLIAFELSIPPIISSIVLLIISFFFFFAPVGIVIDQLNPQTALYHSIKTVFAKLDLVLALCIIALVFLSIIDFVFLQFSDIGSFLALAINSLFVVPFLIVFQTQIYLSKYTIIK